MIVFLLETFPLLIVLFGVTSGTIMVAAIIMMVILCQRKQRKTKQTAVTEKPDVTVTSEDLFKENDRNSNISDLKLELRQANGTCEVVRKFSLFLPILFSRTNAFDSLYLQISSVGSILNSGLHRV